MRICSMICALVEPETRGDPQSPLLWTSKSLRKLSQSLRDMGHTIGRTLVGELLHRLDYRLQANRKTREGSHNPDSDAQFHYINDRVKEAKRSRQVSRRSLSTPRRRSLSAISRTPDANGDRRVRPRKFACMISSFPNSGAPHPMVSTISPPAADKG